jgi:lipopolysaccharide/colanic/teichoic acid biosynthesis glycosyltransferase
LIGFDEMLVLDHVYVTTWSLWTDCSLIARTIPIVFKGGQGDY